jgi:hypothetical protein
MKVLPENFLRCLKPEDRKAMGQRTAGEVMANGIAKSEKELQKQLVGLLRLNGIEPNVSAMHKATTHRVGWPDITFAAYGVACAWEVKLPNGQPSMEQVQMVVRLSSPPNSWRHRFIHSVDEALAELRAIQT